MQEDDQYVPQCTYKNNRRPSSNPHKTATESVLVITIYNHKQLKAPS